MEQNNKEVCVTVVLRGSAEEIAAFRADCRIEASLGSFVNGVNLTPLYTSIRDQLREFSVNDEG